MTADKLLYSDLTYKIRGAIYKVYNTLGFGHKETVYHKALCLEFKKTVIKFAHEVSLDVFYDEQKVGNYRPDFVIDNKILVEIKALSFLGKDAETQMIYYLKGTGYGLGLLVNFGSNELQIKRKIWSGHPRKSATNQR